MGTHKVSGVCIGNDSKLIARWFLLRDHRDLFKEKIGRVVIVGGVETDAIDPDIVKLDDEGQLIKCSSNLLYTYTCVRVARPPRPPRGGHFQGAPPPVVVGAGR